VSGGWQPWLRLALGAALLSLPAWLAGCAAAGPHIDNPAPVVVKEAVPVACVAAGDVPAMPAPVSAQLNGEARHDADLLAAADLALRGALARALALLGACAVPAGSGRPGPQ